MQGRRSVFWDWGGECLGHSQGGEHEMGSPPLVVVVVGGGGVWGDFGDLRRCILKPSEDNFTAFLPAKIL